MATLSDDDWIRWRALAPQEAAIRSNRLPDTLDSARSLKLHKVTFYPSTVLHYTFNVTFAFPFSSETSRMAHRIELSNSRKEVLKILRIEDNNDAWWKKTNKKVGTELRRLRLEFPNPELTWRRLETEPSSQELCQKGVKTVLLGDHLNRPLELRNDGLCTKVLRWMFAYHQRIIGSNTIRQSKLKATASQLPQGVPGGVSSPPNRYLPAEGSRTAEQGNTHLGLSIEGASNKQTSALPAGAPRLSHTVRPATSSIALTSSQRRFRTTPTFYGIPVGDPSKQHIEDFPSIAIRCPAAALGEASLHRMYHRANMVKMEKKYGTGYANYDDSNEPPVPVLHQDLALWHLLQDLGRQVYFEDWPWLHKQARLLKEPNSNCTEQAKAFQPGEHSFVFLLNPGPLDQQIRRTIDILDIQVHTSPKSLAMFPPSTELFHTCQKFGDLEALDDIAAGEHYRPKNCFIGEKHKHFPHDGCPLIGEQHYVAKRNNSACSIHVVESDKAVSQELRQDGTRHTSALGINRWFYQERVPFLKDVGEFRVFIATTIDPCKTRRRRGRHLHSIFTKPLSKGGFAAFALDESYWSQYLAAFFEPLTQDDLYVFALEVFEALRARQDWKLYYESLEVGVRLDIGVSSDKKFFVNEITRIWCGDFFSDHTLGEPKQKVVWAVAKALHEYYQ